MSSNHAQSYTHDAGKPRAAPLHAKRQGSARGVIRTQAWGRDFDKLTEQLWDMMNEMTARSCFQSRPSDSWDPRLNVYETANRYIVCAELAGMSCKEIDIQVSDGMLHIRGFRKRPTLPENPGNVGVHLMEIDSGRFHRKIAVPTDVAADDIKATYRQGYLWIVMPRANDATESNDA